VDEDEEVLSNPQSRDARNLTRVLRNIGNDIKSLSQVSVLIRRPGYSRKYIHSTGNAAMDPRITYYSEHDIRYVIEKFHAWKQQPKLVDDEEPMAAPEVVASANLLAEFPEHQAHLIRRLALANTRRREQLLYWSRHPDQPPTQATFRTYQLPKRELSPDMKARDNHEDASGNEQADEIPHAMYETGSQGQRTIMTTNTFTTVAASDVFGAQTVSGPVRTIYAESTVGNRSSNRVPELRKVLPKDDTFECSYCHAMLDTQKMRNRLEWK
jgi:hypothetical protein